MNKVDNVFQFSFSKDLKHVVPKTKNILLMNPSTMKTLKYNKGSLVLVHTEQGQLLFRCWPCPSLEPSFIMVKERNFFQDYLKGLVYCDCYNLFLDSSYMVILNCDNHKIFMETESFKKFLKTQLKSVYIREGFKFNIMQCCFTVKRIYSNAADKTICQDSVHHICTNMSSLNISGDNSMLENSTSDSLIPFCSTPITKHSISHMNLPNQEMSQIKQFYCVNSRTEIIIEKTKKINSSSNQILLRHLGGLKQQISEMETLILSLFNQDSISKKLCYGVILVGSSGIGKTSIVQALSNEYYLPVFNLNDVISVSNVNDIKFHLKKLYNEVIENSPCILFLDNIENLCKRSNSNYSHNDQELTILLSTMIYDLLQNYRHNVLIIGATCDISAVDESVRKPGTLEKEIYFEIPSANSRKEILNKILDRKKHGLNSTQIDEISEMTHGFVGGDLKILCDKADISSPEGIITFEVLKETLKNVKPVSMVDFEFEIPKVKWSDIGGMHAVKKTITEMVDWPLKYAEQFKRFKIKPSRGILLYGPPGCSKTMIAKALVSEGRLNFISIKGPELFNKYVGESEKSVSELFKKARSAAPCVLFFDEIDSLTSIRGSTSGSSNVSERILTQLLIEIDGINILQGVSIIAATNRPDMIDPSFLRPGRFDQMIYVPLPDPATRKEIFETQLKNMPHSADVDVLHLVEATEGYTGAEITHVCREAATSAIKVYRTSPTTVVTMLHFFTALKSVAPRTSKEMIEFYENYNKRNVS